MFAAIGNVALVAAYLHLLSFTFHAPVGFDADHHSGLAAAGANGLDFRQRIGPGQKDRAAGEELAQEVGPQAVAHDRNVRLVDNSSQLPHLLFVEELSFVNENTMWRIRYAEIPEIRIGAKVVGDGGDANARRDLAPLVSIEVR